MCTVISIINNKGGVGKTTSASILSQLLAHSGQRTLAIDLDGQSNLSVMLGSYEEDDEDIQFGYEQPEHPNIAELFRYRYRSEAELLTVIKNTAIPNLDIIPSSKRHKHTQTALISNQTGNNNVILKRALDPIKDRYDFIIIDNAPSSDVLTVNSMFASDHVIVPVRMEGFSYKGFMETYDTINYIKEEHGIDSLTFKGTFITQAEKNTNIYKDLHSTYHEELADSFLKTSIRKDVKINELETVYAPVMDYCPKSNAVTDYAALLLELDVLDTAASERLRQLTGIQESA